MGRFDAATSSGLPAIGLTGRESGLVEVVQPARGKARSLSLPVVAARSSARICTKEYATIAGIFLALIAMALAIGNFPIFYSVDGEVKYLAAQAIAHHLLNPAIAYPYHHLDPGGAFTLPLTGWLNGHEYAGYSLPFLYLTGLCVAIFGVGGVLLPAILGTVALLAAQLRLARLLRIQNTVLVLFVTVAATPILFYSLTLWEHTWGVALFLLGAAVLLPAEGAPQDLHFARLSLRQASSALPAGGMAGIILFTSILVRREMLIPSVLLLALIPFLDRSPASVGRSTMAFMTMCVPLGLILYAHPEPLALGLTHASPGHGPVGSGPPPSRLTKLGWLAQGIVPGIGFVVWTIYLVWLRFRRPASLPLMMVVGSILLGPILVVELLAGNVQSAMDPLLFTPVALWGAWSILLAGYRSLPVSAAYWAVWLLATGGIVVMILFLPDTGGGQWGPRYLLVFFPLLILLSLRAREAILSQISITSQRRLTHVVFGALVGMSLMVQVIGVLSLNAAKVRWSNTVGVVGRLPGSVVVSTGDTTIDMFAPLVPRKQLLWAQTGSDLNRLLADMHRTGVRRVDFVCPRDVACHWSAWSGWRESRVRSSHGVRYAVFSWPKQDRSSTPSMYKEGFR